MIPFDWVQPATLQEAVGLLDPEDSSIRVMAGGTALMLMMKAGVFHPSRLVSLDRIEKRYCGITRDDAGALHIGAMASLAALEYSPEAAAGFPVIPPTMRSLSNIRVRNVARVGGALAHGDPHMDLPPLMAVLGARAHTLSPTGSREIAVEDLYAGYYETILARDELIAEVVVPPLNGRKAAYLKCTSRSADDWPALGLAACFALEGDAIKDIALVVSAATEKVTRLRSAEQILEGATLDDGLLRQAGDAAAEETAMIADAHGSVAYKKELLRVYVGRAVRQAVAEAGHA